jgi:hypothetical protein
MCIPARHDRPSRAPWALGGMLALVLLVEGIVTRLDADVANTTALSWRLSGEAARGEATGCEVLCFGDSLVKHGVLPRTIEARSGRHAYNLAVAAGLAPVPYFLLRRTLDSGARPAAVVVDFKPDMLAGGPRYQARGWQELLGPRELTELAWAARDPTLLATIALGALVPSVRSRHEIRAGIAAALRGEEPPQRRPNLLYARHWRVNKGANVAIRNTAFRGEVGPEDHKKYLSHAWRCHRINRDFVERFLALAESRGIPVYWLLPPIAPHLQARRDETGVDGQFTRFVQSFQARHRNLTVVDARHAGYGADVFVDPVHLDGQGALALSADLADLLAPGCAASAGRWLALAPYRARPAEADVEDVERSRLAVELSEARRRR